MSCRPRETMPPLRSSFRGFCICTECKFANLSYIHIQLNRERDFNEQVSTFLHILHPELKLIGMKVLHTGSRSRSEGLGPFYVFLLVPSVYSGLLLPRPKDIVSPCSPSTVQGVTLPPPRRDWLKHTKCMPSRKKQA